MPDEVSQQASEQSDGDAATAQAGQIEVRVPIIPGKPEPKYAVATLDNDEAKQKRISDKEWQERTEKANQVPVLEKEVEDLKAVADEKTILEQKNAKLEKELAKSQWESRHPVVLNDKYTEEWKRVNNEKRYQELDFDERWTLINREKSTVSKELKDQQTIERSSVPVLSRGSSAGMGLTSEEAAIARAGGLTEDDFKRAGLLK